MITMNRGERHARLYEEYIRDREEESRERREREREEWEDYLCGLDDDWPYDACADVPWLLRRSRVRLTP